MRFPGGGTMRWPAKVACGKMSCPHLTAKRASQDQRHLAATSKNRAFCDANTTSDNFFRSLRLAAPQLSQSFFTKSGVYTGPGADAQWLGSQIPDTAPYIEWLAIVCSVMAVLACTGLFSDGVLTSCSSAREAVRHSRSNCP